VCGDNGILARVGKDILQTCARGEVVHDDGAVDVYCVLCRVVCQTAWVILTAPTVTEDRRASTAGLAGSP
jgi:hypothetical protein